MRHEQLARRPLVLLLEQIGRLLETGQTQKALDLLDSAAADDPHVQNARGVCLMRIGRVQEAIALYRQLVMHGSELNLDLTQPTAFLTNFATALLLDNNIQGCRGILAELRDGDHPSVVRLRGILERWKRGLGWWNRLMFSVYGEVKEAVPLDHPPGELVLPEAGDPAPSPGGPPADRR